ncbi:MAG: hypothetical protein ACPG80_03510, partial [Rickettsiales bacterium]
MTSGELPSRISTKVDFEKDGKESGYLVLPHSRNESAWGAIRLPVTVIKNGKGPTVLMTGASHGDEYEGPIALSKLSSSLEPEEVSGRVIIIPALNLPALRAGTRLSPIDGKNMNRIFPGSRNGSVTEMIAHYVSTKILPLCDVVLDIHSGGKTLDFIPCSVMHQLQDEQLMKKTLGALEAFGAPAGLVLKELDHEGMLDTIVEESGKIFLSTELGGGGTVTPATMEIADTGVRNLLAHFGVTQAPVATREERGFPPTRLLHTPDDTSYVAADGNGIYEACTYLGQEVSKGQVVGRIHFIETPNREPIDCIAERSGV